MANANEIKNHLKAAQCPDQHCDQLASQLAATGLSITTIMQIISMVTTFLQNGGGANVWAFVQQLIAALHPTPAPQPPGPTPAKS
jgi:hypothetical protein